MSLLTQNNHNVARDCIEPCEQWRIYAVHAEEEHETEGEGEHTGRDQNDKKPETKSQKSTVGS